jgi:hypothetical protein
VCVCVCVSSLFVCGCVYQGPLKLPASHPPHPSGKGADVAARTRARKRTWYENSQKKKSHLHSPLMQGFILGY